MDKICPYCRSQHLIKNGSAYGVPKWKCKDCLRQTSFKPPRGEPLWKKETAVLLYTLGLSMNAIAKQLGVSTPSILNWIRAHAATHAPRPHRTSCPACAGMPMRCVTICAPMLLSTWATRTR